MGSYRVCCTVWTHAAVCRGSRLVERCQEGEGGGDAVRNSQSRIQSEYCIFCLLLGVGIVVCPLSSSFSWFR